MVSNNNIQACEQLNAWLGGFQTILKQMTVNNFNWFIHAMVFLHTERVIEKQLSKELRRNQYESDSDEEDNLAMED